MNIFKRLARVGGIFILSFFSAVTFASPSQPWVKEYLKGSIAVKIYNFTGDGIEINTTNFIQINSAVDSIRLFGGSNETKTPTARYTVTDNGIVVFNINFDAKDGDELSQPSFSIRQATQTEDAGSLTFKIYRPFQANNDDLINARLVSGEALSGNKPILITATIDKIEMSKGTNAQYRIEIRNKN